MKDMDEARKRADDQDVGQAHADRHAFDIPESPGPGKAIMGASIICSTRNPASSALLIAERAMGTSDRIAEYDLPFGGDTIHRADVARSIVWSKSGKNLVVARYLRERRPRSTQAS